MLAFGLFRFDHALAAWFHQRLTDPLAQFLLIVSGAGSGVWIGIMLAIGAIMLARRRKWHALISLILIVPGGLLLNEGIKVLVHRHRPFLHGPYVNWDGYSFPSGHAMGATLLYGIIFLALARVLKTSQRRTIAGAVCGGMVLLVAFSRIALGAHYLSDVIAAIVLGVTWLALCRRLGAIVRRRLVQLQQEAAF